MQSYKSWRNPAKAGIRLSQIYSYLRVGVFMIGFFFVGQLSGDNEKWVPYDTKFHREMGENSSFTDRLTNYLEEVKNLKGDELIVVFNWWFATNWVSINIATKR